MGLEQGGRLSGYYLLGSRDIGLLLVALDSGASFNCT